MLGKSIYDYNIISTHAEYHENDVIIQLITNYTLFGVVTRIFYCRKVWTDIFHVSEKALGKFWKKKYIYVDCRRIKLVKIWSRGWEISHKKYPISIKYTHTHILYVSFMSYVLYSLIGHFYCDKDAKVKQMKVKMVEYLRSLFV